MDADQYVGDDLRLSCEQRESGQDCRRSEYQEEGEQYGVVMHVRSTDA